jgi:hypothetical protein
MPFCTIVEFEWNAGIDRAAVEDMLAAAGASVPDGLLTRIVGIDDSAARVVEVWRSRADAMAFAEQSAPVIGQLPAPSRVMGFEASSFQTA